MDIQQKVEWLSTYGQRELCIERLMKERCWWKRRMEVGGICAKCRVVELEQALDREIDRQVDDRKAMEMAIQTVEDERLRLLLEYRYFDQLSWEELAEKMNYSYQHVFRLHKQALKAIQTEATNRR